MCNLQLAREVLDIAAMMVKPGVTTEEIDHAVHLVHAHAHVNKGWDVVSSYPNTQYDSMLCPIQMQCFTWVL